MAAALAAPLAGCQPRTNADTPSTRKPDPKPRPTTEGLALLKIEDQSDYWTEAGYVELVPTIPLPTTHDYRDLIRTVIRLPEGAKIGARLSEPQRHTVTYPLGTRCDRVEGLRVEDGGFTIIDVRGSSTTAGGIQRFHVFRPLDGQPEAELLGWSWPRGDVQAHARATGMLLDHLEDARRPVDQPPLNEDGRERIGRLNDCAGCHEPNRPAQTDPSADRPVRRATDDLGFYISQSVLDDACRVAHHRPENRIDEDPFVEVRCGDAPAKRVEEGREGERFYRCDNGEVPTAIRDIEAALAADHDYTYRVCASRQFLYDNMSEAAREAFSASFASCGIGQDGRRFDTAVLEPRF